MQVIRNKIALTLGFATAFAACETDSTGLKDVRESVVVDSVRVEATAKAGADPSRLMIEMKLMNTASTARGFAWGGCGVTVRLYQSNSVAFDSYLESGACDDLLHTMVAQPAQLLSREEIALIDRMKLGTGHYDVVMVFRGKINNAPAEFEVRAGTVEL